MCRCPTPNWRFPEEHGSWLLKKYRAIPRRRQRTTKRRQNRPSGGTAVRRHPRRAAGTAILNGLLRRCQPLKFARLRRTDVLNARTFEGLLLHAHIGKINQILSVECKRRKRGMASNPLIIIPDFFFAFPEEFWKMQRKNWYSILVLDTVPLSLKNLLLNSLYSWESGFIILVQPKFLLNQSKSV